MKTGIKGLPKLLNSLEKMGKGITSEIVQEILTDTGNGVAAVMKSKVKRKSGRLANSIKVLKNPKYPFHVIVGPDFTPDGKGTMTKAALSAVLEYGAKKRLPRKGESKKVLIEGEWKTISVDKPFKAIPAKPFIRPTYDMTKNDSAQKIKTAIAEEIIKQAKKEKII